MSEQHEKENLHDERIARVLERALSLSDELRATVLELTDVLRSNNEERGSDSGE